MMRSRNDDLQVNGLRSWNECRIRRVGGPFLPGCAGRRGDYRHQVVGADVVRLKLGHTGLGVFDAKDGPRPGVPHHTFDFEGPRDPNAMVEELEAKGVKVENVRMHGSGPGYSVYCYDPSGNRIELSTDPA